MLNSETALAFADRIQAARDQASDNEAAILAELRALPDYGHNEDADLLEAVRLRAEARELTDQADTILSAFDYIYDETKGENVRKVGDGA